MKDRVRSPYPEKDDSFTCPFAGMKSNLKPDKIAGPGHGLVLNREAPSTRQLGLEKKAFGALIVSKCATLKLVHRASGPSALKLSVAGAGRTRISTVIRNNRTDKNKAEEPLVCC